MALDSVFITGLNGYIGGSIGTALQKRGVRVSGLVRNLEAAKQLEDLGFESINGALADVELLAAAIRNSDAVIHTADSDDINVANTFIDLLEGSGKPFIYTSGSAIVAEQKHGEYSDFIYTEDYPLDSDSCMPNRVAINNAVLRAARKKIRSIVITPTMVYGTGTGIAKHSKQIPMLTEEAKKRNRAVYIGKGENVWSNVHIDDLVDLYLLALEKAAPGSLFYAENGESNLITIAEKISQAHKFKEPPLSISADEAASIWGAFLSALGLSSNSRVSADKARLMLGWEPQHTEVIVG